MNKPPIEPEYDDRKSPEPYVEMLIRCSDDSEEVEIVYLSPMDGDRLRPDALPKPEVEAADGPP
jgi:hypothetical protein